MAQWQHINDQTIADEPQAPVGGIKDSGFGHFGGRWGAEFFTETRWITIGTPAIRSDRRTS